MSITMKLTMVLCLTAAIASSAAAAPLVWTGTAGDNNWMTGGNWDTGIAPGQTSGSPDSVTFGVQGINSASHTIGGNVFYVNAITVGADGSPPNFGTGTKHLADATSGGKIVLQATGGVLPSITAFMLATNDGTDDVREVRINAPIELQADTVIERIGTVGTGRARRLLIYSNVSGAGNLTLKSNSGSSWYGSIAWYGQNTFSGDVSIGGGSHLYLLYKNAFGDPQNQVTVTGAGTTAIEFASMADGSEVPNNVALSTTGSVFGMGWGWNDSTPVHRDCTWSGDFTGGQADAESLRFWNRDWRRLFFTGENSTFTGRVGLYDGTEIILAGANGQGIAWQNVERVRLNTSHLAGEKTTAFLLRGSYTFNAPLDLINSAGECITTIGQMNNGATAYNATFTGKINVQEPDYQALNLYAEAGGSARFQGNIFGASSQGFVVNRSFDEIEGVVSGTRRYGSPTGTVILDTTSRVALTDGGAGSIGPVNVARGTLQVDTDHFYASTVSIAPEATLSGTGRVSAAVTLGGTHAPGNSVGSQTVGSATWLPGGKFEFEINDAEGAAGGGLDGLGWDLLVVGAGAGAGTLDLRGLSSASPFEIHVASLNGESAGNAANFVATQPYDWVFVTYDELVDDYFAPDLFTLNTDDFSNGTGEGYFAITQVTNGLAVSFIPEPGALAMALTALALLLCRRRRT